MKALFYALICIISLYSVGESASPEYGTITGQILDPSGSPVDGCLVAVRSSGLSSKDTTTDARGWYVLEGLIPGIYELTALRKDNLQEYKINRVSVISGTVTIQDITLSYSGSIKGIITDEVNNPVNGATILIERFGNINTDSSGEYHVSGVFPGNYLLTILPPEDKNLLPQKTVVQVNSGTITIQDVSLSKGGVITGTVTDMDSKPVANVMVDVCRVSGGVSSRTYTNEDGRFVIHSLPTDNYRLKAYSSSNIPSDVKEIFVTAGGTATCNLALSPYGVIMGTVTDASGNPIEGVVIEASSVISCYAKTDASGNYRIDNLLTGTYSLMIFPSEGMGLGKWMEEVVLTTGTMMAVQNICLSPTGSITGKLIDVLGQPVARAWIQAGSLQNHFFSSLPVQADDTGNFTLSGLTKGMYALIITSELQDPFGEGYKISKESIQVSSINEITLYQTFIATATVFIATTTYGSNTITVAAPHAPQINCPYRSVEGMSQVVENVIVSPKTTTTMEITLNQWARIIGEVRDRNGVPVKEAVLKAKKTPFGLFGSDRSATTDANGRYCLDWIQDTGTYQLTVSPPEDVNLLGTTTNISTTIGSVTSCHIILDEGGILTGCVRDGSGKVFVGARIFISEKVTMTDAEGRYTLMGLAQGTYSLTIIYQKDIEMIKQKLDIMIKAGTTTCDIVFLTEATGAIGGRVMFEPQVPANYAVISISSSEDYRGTVCSVDGSYKINGLIPGNYIVSLRVENNGYHLERSIQNLIIQTGTTTIKDFLLYQEGIIMGQVRDSSGTPIRDAQVEISSSNSSAWAYTDSNGSYKIDGLASANYQMRVYFPSSLLSLKEQGITVRAGSVTIHDILFYKGDGAIFGRVTDKNGRAIADARIIIQEKDTYTDDNGFYLMNDIVPGIYLMKIDINSKQDNLIGQQIKIEIIKGSITTKNIILAQGGIIIGQVKDKSGQPVKAVVMLKGINIEAKMETDSSGSFTFTALPTGSYEAIFYPQEGVNLIFCRQSIHVTAGSITTIDITMHQGGILKGRITNEFGNEVTGVSLCIKPNAGGNYIQQEDMRRGQTNLNGEYSLVGIDTGTYTLEIVPNDCSGLMSVNLPCVSITQGGENILDYILNKGGIITGTITDEAGKSAGWANIIIEMKDSAFNWQTAVADANGHYLMGGLKSGTYTIHIIPSGGDLIFLSITNVCITHSSTITKNFTIPAVAKISGKIEDASGMPIFDVYVTICINRDGENYVRGKGAVNGQYSFDNLPPGTYTLLVSSQGNVNILSRKIDGIVVKAGTAIIQNVVLSPGGIISGQVNNTAGNPISNVNVYARGEENNWYSRTNLNGEYNLSGLPTGSYRIEVRPPDGSVFFKNEVFVQVIVGQTINQDIVLKRGGIVCGTIIDPTLDGQEKCFAVFALPAGTKLDISYLERYTEKLLCLKDNLSVGAYTLGPLATGSYDIYLGIKTNKPRESVTILNVLSSVAITEGDIVLNCDLTIPSYGNISGTISCAGNIRIYVTTSEGIWVGQAEFDKTEGYIIRYLSAGTYTVMLGNNYSNIIDSTLNVVIREGTITRVNFTDTPYNIIGTIKDKNEKPIPDAMIIFLDWRKTPIATTTTNANGAFAMDKISRWVTFLKVIKQGYIAHVKRVSFDNNSNTTIANITLLEGEGMSMKILKWDYNDILLEGKASLNIPCNALSVYEETVCIVQIPRENIPVLHAPNLKPTGLAYEFTPDNLIFTAPAPAIISLSYTDEEIAGLNEDKLSVFEWKDGKWVHISGSLDKRSNTLTFNTSHLCLYAIMEYTPLPEEGKIICYPNPFCLSENQGCTIAGIPLEAKTLRVAIYNIAGELVREFEGDEIQKGVDSQFVIWNGQNQSQSSVASGIYIYLIRMEDGCVKGKIGVVR